METTLETLTAFLLRVLPGLLLGIAVIVLLRKEHSLRVVIYLALFILFRDAMTPQKLWFFGGEGGFWIRLPTDPWFLILFGLSSAGIVLAMYFLDRPNKDLVRWLRGSSGAGVVWGLVGSVAVVAPLVVTYQFTDIGLRGGPVARTLLVPLLCFAILGNLYEEALFRGYVLGWLNQRMTLLPAGLVSGLVFAFCHIFLACTVTNAGVSLLLFTLWEGIIAGIVGAKAGVLPSTITHGGAIFFLSSGLV